MSDLKKIILLIADENQLRQAVRMQESMGREKDRCFVYEAGSPYEEYKEKEVLYITDSEKVMRKLQGHNRYTAALLHDNNQEEDFFGVPYAITDIGEQTFASLEKAYLRLSGQPWTVMETARCIIREMTVDDVDSFYKIYEEPAITRYMENLYEDREEEKEYTKEYIEKIYGFYGYGLWTIVDKGSGEIMGRAGLSWREGFPVPELGFVIASPYQRRGYAYEVCSAIVAYGREELGFGQIQALICKENTASISLCSKLGFVYRDTVEDKGQLYQRYVM